MPRPTVSVVVPAYNAAAFLRRAIDSVLGQTAVDLELLVVDDGSTDATLQLLAGYGERLRAISQVNAGPAGARNRGLALARGRYIAFLDADDWWLPEKLGRQVALLDSRPEIGFCSTGTRVVHADGTPAGDWPCAHCCWMLGVSTSGCAASKTPTCGFAWLRAPATRASRSR